MSRFFLLIIFAIPVFYSCECSRLPETDVRGHGSQTTSKTQAPTPQGVKFERESNGNAKISWSTTNNIPEGNYKIYRKSDNENSYTEIGSVNHDKDHYIDGTFSGDAKGSSALLGASYKVAFDPNDKTKWSQSQDSEIVRGLHIPSNVDGALKDIVDVMRLSSPSKGGSNSGPIFIPSGVSSLSDMENIELSGNYRGTFKRTVNNSEEFISYHYDGYMDSSSSAEMNGVLRGSSWDNSKKSITLNGSLRVSGKSHKNYTTAIITFNDLVVCGSGSSAYASSGNVTVAYKGRDGVKFVQKIEAVDVPESLLNFP